MLQAGNWLNEGTIKLLIFLIKSTSIFFMLSEWILSRFVVFVMSFSVVPHLSQGCGLTWSLMTSRPAHSELPHRSTLQWLKNFKNFDNNLDQDCKCLAQYVLSFLYTVCWITPTCPMLVNPYFSAILLTDSRSALIFIAQSLV